MNKIFHCKTIDTIDDNDNKSDIIKIKSPDLLRETTVDNMDNRLTSYVDEYQYDPNRETTANFRETTVDDFDLDYLYDEYGTYKDVDMYSLNEEQLCRHISCLNFIRSKQLELQIRK
jgi:hypothetical protein